MDKFARQRLGTEVPVRDVAAPETSDPTLLARSGLEAGLRLADLERAAIVEALELEANNRTRAAKRLGISRRGLLYKLKKFGLDAPR
jgi:transcriptional regulator with PAS, ATPase and Fis domain